ncbi:hypothetical protein N7508_007904 [Penicillium antarcticum]|uniref:uncharacterized protein n=1 Tax=Penicillium antarcticum TaxID=416450 RepID=UPI0023A3E515|nr:uncharacterized protein N7508_007904 [Penicillium antarcticum]KAJ5297655.1 hypothetical protein N7508_007904 [Penicillium antarcticum]
MFSKSNNAATLGVGSIMGFLLLPHTLRQPWVKSFCYLLVGTLILNNSQIDWTKVSLAMFSLSMLAILGAGSAWMLMAAYFRRQLVLMGDQNGGKANDFIGRPLLFPTKLSHSRMFPERYNYWYSYFVVGIPVGLSGHIGSVLSIDETRSDEGGVVTQSASRSCWFTIDHRYYLDHGDNPRGLEGKLHAFLQSKGENPIQWPYAYMISTPHFLWSTKNTVSWFFLYSDSRALDAMVLEINNSFGEKKLVFFRFSPFGQEIEQREEPDNVDSAIATTNEGPQSMNFLQSRSKFKTYKAKWDKDMFISPFEKVEGYLVTSCDDPCNSVSGNKGPFNTNSTLFSPDGKPKLISRVFSWGQPIDPLSDSAGKLIKFLAGWCFVGALTKFRILHQAFRVWSRGNLTYLQKPEVRKENISRIGTEVERSFESYFRMYISFLAANTPFPLQITYKPSASPTLCPEEFYSISAKSETTEMQKLTIQVLTPGVYIAILGHTNAAQGFDAQIQPSPVPADNSSNSLWVSDRPLIEQLLACADSATSAPEISLTWGHRSRKWLITWLRKSKSTELTFVDRFVYRRLCANMQRDYQYRMIRLLLPHRFGLLASDGMLFAYNAIGRVIIACLGLRLAYRSNIVSHFAKLEDLSIALSVCMLLYGTWKLGSSY